MMIMNAERDRDRQRQVRREDKEEEAYGKKESCFTIISQRVACFRSDNVQVVVDFQSTGCRTGHGEFI